MSFSIICRICGANCDRGELRDGICFDCTIERKKQELIDKKVKNISHYKQIKMEDYLNGK